MSHLGHDEARGWQRELLVGGEREEDRERVTHGETKRGRGWRGARSPVRAFRNPEYHCCRCRIHIYAASPGDNSAIMRRARARPSRRTAFVPLFPLPSLSLCLSLSRFIPPLSLTLSFLVLSFFFLHSVIPVLYLRSFNRKYIANA